MSWLTKIGSGILHGLGVVAKVVTSPAATAIEQEIPLVGTFAALINPRLAALIKKGDAIVNGVEALITTAQAGAVKHATAISIATSEIPNLEEIAAQFGANVTIPQAELSAALNASVDLYNKWQAFYAALHAANQKPATPAA